MWSRSGAATGVRHGAQGRAGVDGILQDALWAGVGGPLRGSVEAGVLVGAGGAARGVLQAADLLREHRGQQAVLVVEDCVAVVMVALVSAQQHPEDQRAASPPAPPGCSVSAGA
eukprot:1196847-Rhodomonas_salina.3